MTTIEAKLWPYMNFSSAPFFLFYCYYPAQSTAPHNILLMFCLINVSNHHMFTIRKAPILVIFTDVILLKKKKCPHCEARSDVVELEDLTSFETEEL